MSFLLVPDEELGTPYSRPWIQEEARGADWAFVMEPGRENGGVVTSRSVVGKFTVRAEGRSAHCGVDYERGASAVRELALKVPALESLTRLEQGVIVNVGVFKGGEARQVIPAAAEMLVDFRAPDQAEAERLMARIRAMATSRAGPRGARSPPKGSRRGRPSPARPGRCTCTSWRRASPASWASRCRRCTPAAAPTGAWWPPRGWRPWTGWGRCPWMTAACRSGSLVSTLVPRALLLANLILALDRERNGERRSR